MRISCFWILDGKVASTEIRPRVLEEERGRGPRRQEGSF